MGRTVAECGGKSIRLRQMNERMVVVWVGGNGKGYMKHVIILMANLSYFSSSFLYSSYSSRSSLVSFLFVTFFFSENVYGMEFGRAIFMWRWHGAAALISVLCTNTHTHTARAQWIGFSCAFLLWPSC